MWIFWILALLPITVCGGLVLFNKNVSYVEWLTSTGVALLMALIFQVSASIGMTDDIETWSGYVTSARQFSRWQEYYQEAIYRTEYYEVTERYTDSDGERRSRRVTKSRRVFDHWEDCKRWHQAYWEVYTTIGDWPIDQTKYLELTQKFDDNHPVAGRRKTSEHNSKMIGGDPNDYVADNKTRWIEPVTTTKHFKNKIKAAPSLFSYANVKVPTNINIYPWPKSQNLFVSDRVIGTANSAITTLKWDQMNAVLGASKRVNLIIVGFGDKGMDMATWQEAKWIGGKKNDLVICYGGKANEPATWVKVFGWTEKNIVKQNLQTIFLDNPVNDTILPLIQSEVVANYIIKDWKKFDYITIEPPTWCYWVYFIVMLVVQGGLFFWYHVNYMDKDTDGSSLWRWPKATANFLIRSKNTIKSFVDRLNRKVRGIKEPTPVPALTTQQIKDLDYELQKKNTWKKCGKGGI
jgi:hypothetical protein